MAGSKLSFGANGTGVMYTCVGADALTFRILNIDRGGAAAGGGEGGEVGGKKKKAVEEDRVVE